MNLLIGYSILVFSPRNYIYILISLYINLSICIYMLMYIYEYRDNIYVMSEGNERPRNGFEVGKGKGELM